MMRLKWLRNQKDPRGKFARWIMELEQYEYSFEYKPGVEHITPDALSRIESGKSTSDHIDKFTENVYNVEYTEVKDNKDWLNLVQSEQQRDSSIRIAIEQLEEKGKISTGKYKNFHQLFIKDGVLVKSGRIIVPDSLKYQITKDYHETNHLATENTRNAIKEKYYWPNMKDYVEKFCSMCDVCLKTKHPQKKAKAKLHPINWADYYPRQAIALDIATMAPSSEGYRYILLIVDGMSKYVELCPLRNITGQSVTNSIKRQWIARHGAPDMLLSDQGKQVDGVEIRKLCDEYGIEKKRSSPYHPEGDGISERSIGIMKGMFRSKLAEKKLPPKSWPEVYPDVQLSMNCKPSTSTKYSAFQLMNGEEKHRQKHAISQLEEIKTPDCSTNTLVEETSYTRSKNINEAKKNLQKSAEAMQRQYDKKATDFKFKCNDLVYRKKNYVKPGESKKLSVLYYDLSKIIEEKSPNYLIESVASKKRRWIHFNQLRLKQSFPIFDKRTIKCKKPDPANQKEFHVATDPLLEDLSNDYVIIDNDPEDVDPFDTSSQLDNFPIPDDVNSINENSHENPDTSSPINLTGGATGSENSEGDQEDSEQSVAASEYDRGAAGTSTV